MVWELILLVILMFGLGGCVGALIVLRYLEKSADEMMASYNRVINSYQNIVQIDNNMIECLKNIIRSTYRYLVLLRSEGHEDLDDIIGNLAEVVGEESDDGNGVEEKEEVAE